jgi:hypothetical protein
MDKRVFILDLLRVGLLVSTRVVNPHSVTLAIDDILFMGTGRLLHFEHGACLGCRVGLLSGFLVNSHDGKQKWLTLSTLLD